MSRNPRLYLEDIQNSCQKIQHYKNGMTFSQFCQDNRTFDAVVRNMPDEIKELHLEVEWRSIGALRNLLAHEYFGIKDEIIWDILEHKLPMLLDQVLVILDELES
jgi:uncharacterized protein with HEPN domain